MYLHESDVLVIGAGPSGIAAAVSAAREGVKTTIIEGQGCAGGMATSGQVYAFAPYNYNNPDGNPLLRGIAIEVPDRIGRAGGLFDTSRYWKLFDKEVAKVVFEEMLLECGIKIRYFTTFFNAVTKEGTVKKILTVSKNGVETWKARIYVDATGDADVCSAAGVPFDIGNECGETMAPTLCFMVVNADRRKIPDMGAVAEAIYRGKREGRLTNPEDFRGCRDIHGPFAFTFNYNHIYGTDCLDADSLTKAMIEGRKIAFELLGYLKETVPGFEDAFIASTASLLGVRETRRIKGEFCLTGEAYFKSDRHDDDICVYDYAIDLHQGKADEKSRKEYEKIYYNMRTKPGEFYGIPFRCLLPIGVNNLICAGRSVSCDRFMQASLRVMPACMATGQAAGTAAAMAVKKKCSVRDLKIQELKSRLIDNGVYLP